MIPFPLPELDPSSMIGIAIENYFYPIITGQLVVEVDGIEIVASNIRELAKVHAKKRSLTLICCLTSSKKPTRRLTRICSS
ncbi:MAG: hypothetical protein H6962_08415 [Chromatiaceae bacterium]|nr:hypothetical protein [Chromatiaceae bacterium]